MRTTFPDEWSEAEYARQVARIEFRLYDHDAGMASIEQPFIDEVMRKIANVPERLLPARRFNDLIEADHPCAEAAEKWKRLYREKQGGLVSFHQLDVIDPDPLLVAQLRFRLVNGAVIHFLSWRKFVAWVSDWVGADEGTMTDAREELRRLENVYDALAISDLGAGEFTPNFMHEYMTRILILRSDNNLATYFSDTLTDDGFARKFGKATAARLAEGCTVDV